MASSLKKVKKSHVEQNRHTGFMEWINEWVNECKLWMQTKLPHCHFHLSNLSVSWRSIRHTHLVPTLFCCSLYLSTYLPTYIPTDLLTYLFIFWSIFFSFLRPHLLYAEVPMLGVGATAASLCHSHSNTGSELYRWLRPQLTATLDP